MASRDELISEMAQIQKDFARFVRNVEQDDLPIAVNYARAMADRMRSVINEIQKNMAADFFNSRAKTFEADLELIQKFEKGAPSRAEQSQIANAVSEFSGTIRSLDTLVRLIYPEPPYSLKPVLERHQKKIGIIAASCLALFLVMALASHIRKQRHGLTGQYFASRNFENPEKRRVDPTINFRYGKGGPFRRWRVDDFSVRWTGYIYIPFADKWTFYTFNDDGARLWIGKRQIINDWNIHGATGNNSTLELSEGYYAVTLEYFEARSYANMQLYWRPSRNRRAGIIPTENLIPNASLLDKDIAVTEDLDHPEMTKAAAPEKDVEDASDRPDMDRQDEDNDERRGDDGDDQDEGDAKAPASAPAPAKKGR
jgi:hypothetical protein